jgi:DNA-binding beta-propeller fold protein YncE
MPLLSKKSAAVAAVAGLALTAVTGVGGAAASTPGLHVIRTLSSAYVAPLQFAVKGHHVYVADSATSTLTEIGRSKPIARGPAPSQNPETSGDLAGVAVGGGAIAYTTNTGDHKDTRLTILRHGHKPVVAHLSAFEAKYNPDHRNRYGLVDSDDASAQCKAEVSQSGTPLEYRGLVDSHAYSVAWLGHGNWAVGDAGGNDVLKVDRWGHVSLLAVLPAQPLKVTAAFAKAAEAPHCVGETYRFEPVPTDVEVGRWGKLYVTTLPGGPEGPGTGARGSVYRLDRHHPTRIATGFSSATNLAISPSGRIYVAELGAGRISTIRHCRPHQVASLQGVVAVEWANGHLYASTAPAVMGGKGPGTIVKLG